MDDPELTVREWTGQNPLRMVIDRKGILPDHLRLFSGKTNTLVFTSKSRENRENLSYVVLPDTRDYIPQILGYLFDREIQSLLVEGGAALLESFIKSGLWDEARVFRGHVSFGRGVAAPILQGNPHESLAVGPDRLDIYRRS
jgi:diaminohydroxyphosphoribosylaminopyrimidine deaminase/5-amino-6-(5-phosphoribosylamino)uracil reductase